MKPWHLGDTPTFGMMVRAGRLGYRWVPTLGGFVRMELLPGYVLAVQLHPAGLISCPLGRASVRHHLIWWDAPDLWAELLKARPTMALIRRVKRAVYFEIPL